MNKNGESIACEESYLRANEHSDNLMAIEKKEGLMVYPNIAESVTI